jgi:transposase
LDRIESYLSIVVKDSSQPAKRRRYDAAFRAEALRLDSESCSTQAAARVLTIDPKRIYKQQKEALTLVAAARGAEFDPVTAAELRQLRAANWRQAQELEILKKPLPSTKCLMRIFTDTGPMSSIS